MSPTKNETTKATITLVGVTTAERFSASPKDISLRFKQIIIPIIIPKIPPSKQIVNASVTNCNLISNFVAPIDL